MPNQDLVAAFKSTHDQWNALGQALAPLAERLAIETVAEVLPHATVLELRGEFNEDWLRILRIRRVRSATGKVLFDVAEGHDDRRVEDAIDEVNYEYLDLPARPDRRRLHGAQHLRPSQVIALKLSSTP